MASHGRWYLILHLAWKWPSSAAISHRTFPSISKGSIGKKLLASTCRLQWPLTHRKLHMASGRSRMTPKQKEKAPQHGSLFIHWEILHTMIKGWESIYFHQLECKELRIHQLPLHTRRQSLILKWHTSDHENYQFWFLRIIGPKKSKSIHWKSNYYRRSSLSTPNFEDE